VLQSVRRHLIYGIASAGICTPPEPASRIVAATHLHPAPPFRPGLPVRLGGVRDRRAGRPRRIGRQDSGGQSMIDRARAP
jgi:hypothetical protein